MPDLDMATLNVIFAALSFGFALISATLFTLARRDRRRQLAEHAALPHGAEAILWSITEATPDPRNHILLKDPTSEVRVTPLRGAEPQPDPGAWDDATSWDQPTGEVAEVAEAAEPRARRNDPAQVLAGVFGSRSARTARKTTDADADADTDAVPGDRDDGAAEGQLVGAGGLRQGRMRGAIDETDVFTGEFFFTGEPQLNRF